MRTSLLALLFLLPACVQGVDVGSEFNPLTTDQGRDCRRAGTGNDIPSRGPDAGGGPCWGGIAITNLEQWEAFEASCCETYDGTLEIVQYDGTALPSVLTNTGLTKVTGTLRIWGAPAVTSIVFQELRTATRVEISTNDGLEIVNFPNLATTEAFEVGGNATLSEVHAPALTYSGSAAFWRDPRLTVLDLPSLTAVPERVFIKDNESLRQCVADGLLAGLQTPPARSETINNGGTPNVCP
jgi:hypothetical protein